MSNNFDRFSLLPESLLLIIISLLPFKEAVRTGILSKRWLHMWENLPHIEFNELHFVKANESFYRRVAQRNVFLQFMTLWLENRKEGVMEKFSLKLSNPDEKDFEIIERCVSFVTQNGVKVLELDFSNPIWEREEFPRKRVALFELPTIVYEHKIIESLKLFSCSFLENGFINFHAVKEVSLGWMEVTLKTLTILFSNCKMIESLILKNCWNSRHFEIGDANDEELRLKRLVVDNCAFQLPFLGVNAPNLYFFKYIGLVSYFQINATSLEEVHFDFNLGFSNVLGTYVYDLMKDLCSVRVVTVCTYVLQVLPIGRKIRMECDMNTRHLILKMNMLDSELRGISLFLNSCPMLECLTLELGFGGIYPAADDIVDYQRMWMDNLSVYECMKSTLKLVEVKDFVWSVNGLLFLNYVIRCGRVLERVNINVLKEEVDGDSKNIAFYREIEEFVMTTPRASSDLQISFCY